MKAIIIEIIPTTSSKYSGDIAQLSALKIDDLKLLDRFDYRLCEDKIKNLDVLGMIQYDKDKFTYVDSTHELLNIFYKWSENFPIYIINNEYTNSYLSDLPNKKIPLEEVLDIKNKDDIIEELMNKYHIQPTNYIVDIIYEVLLYETT